ncbi:MAG: branched-chain amino acid ABC transporter permease [Thermofilum sp.]|nr:branched-chain amino acid ABC transporter permease [Thermofilum sp.]
MVATSEVLAFVVSLGTLYSIYVILSSSMELVYGELGLPDFAKAAFFAVGAFAAGALSVRLGAALAGIAWEGEFKLRSYYYATLVSAKVAENPLMGLAIFVVPLLVAVPCAVLLGVLASYPALRLREDYLAITLIAFSEIVRVVARNYEPLVGGTFGAGVVDVFAWLRSPWRELAMMLTSALFAFGAWLLLYRLSRSPFGRVLRAVRDDEVAAAAYGVDVARVRAWAMALGSGMAAVAGVLYAFYIGSVNPDDFTVSRTFLVVLMVTVGGRGNPKSPPLGAAVYLALDRALLFAKRFLPVPFDVNYVAYAALGVLLILFVMKKPEGLAPERPLLTVDAEATEGVTSRT